MTNFMLYIFLFSLIGPLNQNNQFEVTLISSNGGNVEDAIVKLIVSDSPSYQGTSRKDSEYLLIHRGNGIYFLDKVLFLDHTHDTKLHVIAPDHESVTPWVLRRNDSINIELWHNNYYEKCNQTGSNQSFFSWNRDDWSDCEVDPDRLIEVFGVEVRNILNSNTAHLIDSRQPTIHKYAPEISNDFSNYVPRYKAYTIAIESLLKATALAEASVANTELYEWIELELNANQQISNSELMVKGGQMVSGFTGTFSELNTAMEVAGYAFDVSRAYRGGYLNGILMYIAYISSAVEILDRLEILANHSWMRNDEAFQNSLSDIKDIYERNKHREIEQIAQAIGTNRVGEKVSDIVLGIAIKNALTAAGKSVYTIAAGHAAPAVLAGSFKIVAAAAIYDFIRSVEKTGEQRALLSVIAQMDRTLFSVPDYYSPATIEVMSANQKLDLMMRLQLGVIFNEARAALYSGEFKTWIGYQFQYSVEGALSANQAYELKMVDVSLLKVENGQRDIENLISLMLETKRAETVESNITFDTETVYGTYRRFLNGEPDIHSANFKVLPEEKGEAIIHGLAFYHPGGNTSISPNIGEFKTRAVLQRINNLEDDLGCLLQIEFKDELMIVVEMNKGTMSSCGGHNVTFQGEYLREKQTSVKGVDVYGVTWMNENLNVGHFQNGDPIKEMKSEEEWMMAVEHGIPAWSYYQNNPKYGEIYGKIYNVHVITDLRNVCPAGWRLPELNDIDKSFIKVINNVDDQMREKYSEVYGPYSKYQYPFESSEILKKEFTDLGFDMSRFEGVERYKSGFWRDKHRKTLSFWYEVPRQPYINIEYIYLDAIKDGNITFHPGIGRSDLVGDEIDLGANIRCVKER